MASGATIIIIVITITITVIIITPLRRAASPFLGNSLEHPLPRSFPPGERPMRHPPPSGHVGGGGICPSSGARSRKHARGKTLKHGGIEARRGAEERGDNGIRRPSSPS
jgi:hypothetical protein